MQRPIDTVLEFLRAEQARGVTHVHLDAEARALLRGIQQRAKGSGRGKAGAIAPPVECPDPVAPPDVPWNGTPVASGNTAAERIASLAAQAEHWPPARRLGSLRPTMVFSVGNPEADLMFVGEAPGRHEEQLREPFVGAAGEKLDKIIVAMGLERSQVYISNIVKFRPAMPNQTTSNRKPTLDEMAACLPFVRAEIEVVRPKCIVALGATAAEGLLGLSCSLASMRGKWHAFEGIPTRVTYHPAYLLHGEGKRPVEETLHDKRLIWEDMLEVMEKLGLPISDKQRGFFLSKPG